MGMRAYTLFQYLSLVKRAEHLVMKYETSYITTIFIY